MSSTCFAEPPVAEDLRLNEDEVVALMINMIAFDGDWDAHLDFLEGLGGQNLWEYDQIPLVKDLKRKDLELDIQSGFCNED